MNIAYGSDTAVTITLASLGSSSTWVAGRESTVVQNGTNLFIDALVTGKIRTGTSPTVDTLIQVWVYATRDDTPTYPANFTGADAAVTLASENVRNAAAKLAASMRIDSTSDRDYEFAFSVAPLFGILPENWGLFVTHNTGVNLNSTGGNHVVKYRGITYA